jgi:lysophospholipase L1-like esterase
MRDLLGEARSPATRRLLLAAPPSVFEEGAFNVQAQAVKNRPASLLSALAASEGCEYVDLSGILSADHVSDGVHPTAEGHALIAKAVGQQLSGNDSVDCGLHEFARDGV